MYTSKTKVIYYVDPSSVDKTIADPLNADNTKEIRKKKPNKVITPAEACKIGEEHREHIKESKFHAIMREIAYNAKTSQHCAFEDQHKITRDFKVKIEPNQHIDFLLAHPEQQVRLTNMGYKVISWSEPRLVKYNSYEDKIVYGLFKLFSKEYGVWSEKEETITVRVLHILWTCDECKE